MNRRRSEWGRTRRQDGLTLLEVLLAAVVLSLAGVAVFSLLMVSAQLQSEARHHMEALRAAESLLEAYKARPYEDIVPSGERVDGRVVVEVVERGGLKVVTVTVLYPAGGRPGESVKSVSLTLERGPR